MERMELRTNGTGRRVRAVLYDFDGTLADTTELVMSSWRHTMQEHFGEVPPDEEWLAGFGTPLDIQLMRFARSVSERDAMMATYRAYQNQHLDAVVRPFPGAIETVRELARGGYALAIVTSRFREGTLRAMRTCGLVDLCPTIVTPEDVTHAKPHPEPVERALAELGVAADEALFVGDSPHDIAAGRAAGTRTAGVLWGPFPRTQLEAEAPDFLLARQDEVLRLVGEG